MSKPYTTDPYAQVWGNYSAKATAGVNKMSASDAALAGIMRFNKFMQNFVAQWNPDASRAIKQLVEKRRNGL